MKFGLFLGNYIKTTERGTKIYISVPSNLLFSYFVVLGAIDYDFKNVTKEQQIQQYLNLKKGNKVYYLSGDQWKSYSVLGIKDYPLDPKIKAIQLKNIQGSVSYIPESSWLSQIRIIDNTTEDVRNPRVVKNVSNLSNDRILRSFYSSDDLSLAESENIPYTYIYTNKKEWLEYLAALKLEHHGVKMNFKNFIFDGTGNSFLNIDFISNNKEMDLIKDASIVFVGSSRIIQKMDKFAEFRCIYLVDKHDSSEKQEDIVNKIEQQYLTQDCVTVNGHLIELIEKKQINLPKGVELFAWKQKS